jgi:TPR repeat protein
MKLKVVLFAFVLALFQSLAIAAEDIGALQAKAEQGDPEAQFNLGVIYNLGSGVPRDGKKAVRLWLSAAEKGHATAQAYLGTRYENGFGVPQNYALAFKWYRLAAEQGSWIGQGGLAGMFEKGLGMPKNLIEAYAWYSAADANKGEAESSEAKLREMLAQKLTPAQLAEGQKLAVEYFEKYQPK